VLEGCRVQCLQYPRLLRKLSQNLVGIPFHDGANSFGIQPETVGQHLIFGLVGCQEPCTPDAVFGDITMIVHTGGRERTEAEFASLLDAAGSRLTRIVPTRVAQSVLETVAR
jgi:hypothetical protein